MHAIRYSDLEPCPDCDSENLNGIRWSQRGVNIQMDGAAVQRVSTDGTQGQTFLTLHECEECGELLVQDGEVVHEEYGAVPVEF